MYTEENLLLIRHFRNARVTGTEIRVICFWDRYWGCAGQSPVTVPEVFAKKTRPSFLLVSKVAHVMCGRKKCSRAQMAAKPCNVGYMSWLYCCQGEVSFSCKEQAAAKKKSTKENTRLFYTDA